VQQFAFDIFITFGDKYAIVIPYIEYAISNMRANQFCFQSAVPFNSPYHKWTVQLFITRLTSRGGIFVDLPQVEAGVSDMVGFGSFFDGTVAEILNADTPNDLLADILDDVAEDPAAYELYAGYALYKDGIWRAHDWIYHSESDSILDEDPAKTMYYGLAVAKGNAELAARLISTDEEE